MVLPSYPNLMLTCQGYREGKKNNNSEVPCKILNIYRFNCRNVLYKSMLFSMQALL